MKDHPSEPVLLQHFDGTLPEGEDRAVAAHVAGCSPCRQQLAHLAAFEGFVARHMPGDALTDADMFEAAERVLASRSGTGPRRRWWGVFGATAVALVAAGVALLLWLGSPPAAARFRLVRHTPADPVRQATTVRFHLELDLAEPAFVGAWLRFGDGAVEMLLPEAGAATAVQGVVRLPANALLDWEYAAPRVPRELLVVASPVALDEPVRREVLDAWRGAPAGTVPPAALACGAAQVLAVPDAANPK